MRVKIRHRHRQAITQMSRAGRLNLRTKKPEKCGVKVSLGNPVILHPAKCNFHPNILPSKKAEKCIIRHQFFTMLEEEERF
jgi:hypothetical protein